MGTVGDRSREIHYWSEVGGVVLGICSEKKKYMNKCKKLSQKQKNSCYLCKLLCWTSWVTLHLHCIFISQVQVQRSYSWPCSHSSVPPWCFLHKAILQSTTKAVSISMQPCRNHAETVIPQWVLQRHRSFWSCFEHSDLHVLPAVSCLVCDRKQMCFNFSLLSSRTCLPSILTIFIKMHNKYDI